MAAELCDIGDLPEGNGLEIPLSEGGRERTVALFMTRDGPRAYLDVCPHQGRSLAFAPGEFLLTDNGDLVCPHHGACFDLTTGRCLSGPCEGDALRPVPVRVANGKLWLAE